MLTILVTIYAYLIPLPNDHVPAFEHKPCPKPVQKILTGLEADCSRKNAKVVKNVTLGLTFVHYLANLK